MEKLMKDFLEFEKKYKLFDKKIDDIYFWVLVRKRVIDNIQIDNKLISKLDYTVDTNNVKNSISILKYIFKAFLNAFKRIEEVDVLIINHPRKVFYNNQYVDLYTYPLEKKLIKERKKILILDVPLNWNKHLVKKKSYIRNIENFSIIKKVFYKCFAKNNFLNDEYFNKLSLDLKNSFGSDGNIKQVVFEQLNVFKVDYAYYKKKLQKTKPKKIYVVIAYVHFGLIKAANDLGIDVEEIQHGIISKEHFAYHFPYNKKVPYYPNYMSLYGKYWYDSTSIPIPEKNINYIENITLTDSKKQKCVRKNNQIVFLCQAAITEQLIPYIEGFCKLTDKYKVIVKLHPSEYEVWKTQYPELESLIKRYNLEIVDNFDKKLYNILKESKHVIGVSSTALFEAIYFGCDVHLLEISTVDTMDFLIQNKMVTLSACVNELLKNVENESKGKNKIDLKYFFYEEEENE